MVVGFRRLRRRFCVVLGVVVWALLVASAAQAGVTRFEAGGTADSSYGIYPTDVSSDGRFVVFV